MRLKKNKGDPNHDLAESFGPSSASMANTCKETCWLVWLMFACSKQRYARWIWWEGSVCSGLNWKCCWSIEMLSSGNIPPKLRSCWKNGGSLSWLYALACVEKIIYGSSEYVPVIGCTAQRDVFSSQKLSSDAFHCLNICSSEFAEAARMAEQKAAVDKAVITYVLIFLYHHARQRAYPHQLTSVSLNKRKL